MNFPFHNNYGRSTLAHRELFEHYLTALVNPDDLTYVLAPDFVAHDLPNTGDRDALIAFRRAVMSAFPDQKSQIVDYLETHDRVAARILLQQTHTGPFRNIEPTGQQISLEVYEFVRIDDGMIAERWAALRPSIPEIIQQLHSAAPLSGG